MERLLMNEVLLSKDVLVYLFSESILFALLFIAFILSIKIYLKWDFNSFSPMQFKLEQESYLVTTIAFFIFIIKFFLLLYFAFTVDNLSILVVGAMCGAGVIQANSYGSYLLVLKLFILFGLTLWFYLNHYDINSKNYQWFKEKSALFILLFIFIIAEIYFDFSYFTNINTHQTVSCCSSLFGQLEGTNPLPFGLNNITLLILFYLLFIMIILTLLLNQTHLYILSNLLFLYIAYYALVYFFGTYIYQIPTHKCPFCMLQKEYHYIGYALWFSLFIGSFIGINGAISSLWLKEKTSFKSKQIVIGLLGFFVVVCSSYLLIYYFKNGVWL
jgi:hypothetical protein